MAEQARQTQAPQPAVTPAPAPKASGPALGDIVWVRTDISHVAPAIVTDDFANQNTSGVVSVLIFLGHPYDANLTKHVPNCQPEMDETSAADLTSTYYGYWMPVGSGLRKRDLQKELDEAKPKTEEPVAETKPAT